MITYYFENGTKAKDGLRHVVVGLIVVKGSKILLERRGSYNGKPILESGKWALISGFLDRDERLVDSIKREALEETGVKIKNPTLLKIIDNPNRPNDSGRQNVGFVFFADYTGEEKVDSEEVTETKWFDLEDLPPKDEIAFDFYDEIIFYKKYLKEKFPTPVLD